LIYQKNIKPQYGKLLRRIRRKRGVSVRQLAKDVGVDHTYVSKIELGKLAPPLGTTMLSIAKVLDSPELVEAAEYGVIRQLRVLEMQRHSAYSDMSDSLRNEIGVADLVDFNRSGQLIAALSHAQERREKPSDWKNIPWPPKRSTH
jgi:transcriptional regulator with XRE-family HTH domain